MLDLKGIRFYRGLSMVGTFRPGDCLHFKPEIPFDVSAGDIVIISNMNDNGDSKELVHRVVGRTSRGLVTRGDNNSHTDNLLVTRENLVGKVSHVERNGKICQVHGGSRGLARARILHARVLLKTILKFFLRRGYNILKRSDIVTWLWHPIFKKIHFKTGNGLLVKYLHSNRTAAYWWPVQGSFRCKKPYDLVLRRPDLSGPHKK